MRGIFAAGRRRSPRLERLTSSGGIGERLRLVVALLVLACGVSPDRAGAMSDGVATPGHPVAVSPGSATVSLAAGSCPTFSWGGLAGALRYELAVYRSGGDSDELQAVWSESLPGSVSSWTPPLDLCLERGGRYAWTVRAFDGKTTSAGSLPNLFHVKGEASEAELAEALTMAEWTLAERESAGTPEVAAAATEVALEPRAPAGAPQPLAPGGTQLTVDGNLDAVSFSGDSSLLTDLEADPPCFDLTHRFVNCGNGTVTDTKTGLIWLERANCVGGERNWTTANAIASSLADGGCGLTDGSRPGDWRLATEEEWQAILDPACPTQPKIVGAGSPTSGCYSDAFWALFVPVGPPNVRYWALGDDSSPSAAGLANLSAGAADAASKTSLSYVWPVRGSR